MACKCETLGEITEMPAGCPDAAGVHIGGAPWFYDSVKQVCFQKGDKNDPNKLAGSPTSYLIVAAGAFAIGGLGGAAAASSNRRTRGALIGGAINAVLASILYALIPK